MEVRRLVISGVVQGVGFRYAMMTQARLLGVTGWVRNRRDGSVEAMIAGDAVQIEAMLAWSRRGPAGAVVEDVMVETTSGKLPGFELRPTAWRPERPGPAAKRRTLRQRALHARYHVIIPTCSVAPAIS